MRRRKFMAVAVCRQDRISRNISGFTGLIGDLTKPDVFFVPIRKQIGTSAPMSWLLILLWPRDCQGRCRSWQKTDAAGL